MCTYSLSGSDLGARLHDHRAERKCAPVSCRRRGRHCLAARVEPIGLRCQMASKEYCVRRPGAVPRAALRRSRRNTHHCFGSTSRPTMPTCSSPWTSSTSKQRLFGRIRHRSGLKPSRATGSTQRQNPSWLWRQAVRSRGTPPPRPASGRSEWGKANPCATYDPELLRQNILPRLAGAKLSRIAEAAGCSKASASDIRREKWAPHLSTWRALAELTEIDAVQS